MRLAPEKDWLDFRDDEERVIGWSLTALSKAYEYTLDEKYLNAARIIVQQVADGQSEETGGWDHPLYPNEDKHRPVCVGEKALDGGHYPVRPYRVLPRHLSEEGARSGNGKGVQTHQLQRTPPCVESYS